MAQRPLIGFSDLPYGWGPGHVPSSEALAALEGAAHVGYDPPVGVPAGVDTVQEALDLALSGSFQQLPNTYFVDSSLAPDPSVRRYASIDAALAAADAALAPGAPVAVVVAPRAGVPYALGVLPLPDRDIFVVGQRGLPEAVGVTVFVGGMVLDGTTGTARTLAFYHCVVEATPQVSFSGDRQAAFFHCFVKDVFQNIGVGSTAFLFQDCIGTGFAVAGVGAGPALVATLVNCDMGCIAGPFSVGLGTATVSTKNSVFSVTSVVPGAPGIVAGPLALPGSSMVLQNTTFNYDYSVSVTLFDFGGNSVRLDDTRFAFVSNLGVIYDFGIPPQVAFGPTRGTVYGVDVVETANVPSKMWVGVAGAVSVVP